LWARGRWWWGGRGRWMLLMVVVVGVVRRLEMVMVGRGVWVLVGVGGVVAWRLVWVGGCWFEWGCVLVEMVRSAAMEGSEALVKDQ